MEELLILEEMVSFSSGVSGSKIPRFEMIPLAALVALANRFELGHEKYGPKSWNALQNQQALDDKEWITARASHVVIHALKYLAKLNGTIPDDGDDDAAAITWGGVVLSEAKRRRDAGIEPEKPKRGRPVGSKTKCKCGLYACHLCRGSVSAVPMTKEEEARADAVFEDRSVDTLSTAPIASLDEAPIREVGSGPVAYGLKEIIHHGEPSQ